MRYIGLQQQQTRNNLLSIFLLALFPVLILVFAYVATYIFYNDYGVDYVNQVFVSFVPLLLGGVLIWFLIAYFSNTWMIARATQARSLSRSENKRIYNLVENLCISQNMPMPKINIIEDNSLNAFASGINKNSYTVTLTRGIINKLNDQELEGVIAHELSHIRNHDVRLLIVSIVFVGIFSLIMQMAIRSLFMGSTRRRSNNNDKGGGAIITMVVIIVMAIIAYGIAIIIKLAISRKREYLADAGAVTMTENPLALASALRKISGDCEIESVTNDDVAQLFIEHPSKPGFFASLFMTHPPIQERIRILEQL